MTLPLIIADHPTPAPCSRCGRTTDFEGDPRLCLWCGGKPAVPVKPPCGQGCGCPLCVERVVTTCEGALATLPPSARLGAWERVRACGEKP